MKKVFIFLMLAFGASSLQAESSLEECVKILEDKSRLECYDKHFASKAVEHNDNDPQVTETTAPTYSFETAKTLTNDLKFDELLEYLKGFTLTPDEKEQMVSAVAAAVKPLPASKSELNLAGYKVLSHLKPNNNTYTTKMKSYETAVLNNKTKYFRKLKPKIDEFKGITWYRHPSEPAYRNSRSSIYAYIGKRTHGDPFLRLVTQYSSDSWLFVKTVQVNVDGDVFTLTVADGYRFEGDNGYGGIWEWQDELPNAGQLNIMRKIGEAKKVTIRYTGSQYYDEKQMQTKDIKALKEVLLAYQEMLDNKI